MQSGERLKLTFWAHLKKLHRPTLRTLHKLVEKTCLLTFNRPGSGPAAPPKDSPHTIADSAPDTRYFLNLYLTRSTQSKNQAAWQKTDSDSENFGVENPKASERKIGNPVNPFSCVGNNPWITKHFFERKNMKIQFAAKAAILLAFILGSIANGQNLVRYDLTSDWDVNDDVRAWLSGSAVAEHKFERKQVFLNQDGGIDLEDQIAVCFGDSRNATVDEAEGDFYVESCGGGTLDLGETAETITQFSYSESHVYAIAPTFDHMARAVTNQTCTTGMYYEFDDEVDEAVKLKGTLKIVISGENHDTLETSVLTDVGSVRIDFSHIEATHIGDGKFRVTGRIWSLVDGEPVSEEIDREVQVGEEPVEIRYECEFLHDTGFFAVDTGNDLHLEAMVRKPIVLGVFDETEEMSEEDREISGNWSVDATAEVTIVK